ncbi:MAG: YceI family protein [Myxococcales bacterium]|nr:YceI family protein [Myxococcales bacterium]
MPTVDQDRAQCRVFAFKEGLLSAVGHDVLLKVGRFRLEGEGDTLKASFEAGSLQVVDAMKQGRPNPGALSDKDKRTIEGYVRDDILHSRRYPTVTFEATEIERDEDGAEVTGDLTLHGRTRSVTARIDREGDELVTRVRLNQPDYGITPFKAMLGALKIQPGVEVELRVPADVLAE